MTGQISKEAIEAAHAEINKSWRNDRWEWDAPKHAAERALCAALPFLSTLPIAGEGKVKALEWQAADRPSLQWLFKSFCAIGHYTIGGPLSGDPHYRLYLKRDPIGLFQTIDMAKSAAQADYETRILSALTYSPGKDGGHEVETVAALEYKLKAATSALEEISDTRCVHDMGFDREIGPLGCSLGDKCVCVGLCTIASRALQEITTKALEGQELQAVAWRWKWKDCGSWIVTEGEPDANERRIIEPLYKSAHVAEPVEYHIVFDGFPSPDGPRFIEVENAAGQSINAGEWRKRADGLCELVIKAGVLING